jgi:leucyl/phenylalanyl-tRNA---protein transferase
MEIGPKRRVPIAPPDSRFEMPEPSQAVAGVDLIAIGADLEPGTILSAYRTGLFPMPLEPRRRRSKIAWYSPDPRGVLPLDGLHVSRSLRKSRRHFAVTRDTAFEAVMRACADPKRKGRWITEEFIAAYTALADLGWAHSFEVWADNRLVGGLYGLRIGGLFAGEAMFHTATDASKVALVELVDWLNATGATLLDVQWTTPHLESLGVIAISRNEYLAQLRAAVAATPVGTD